jgi:hypothetical protein
MSLFLNIRLVLVVHDPTVLPLIHKIKLLRGPIIKLFVQSGKRCFPDQDRSFPTLSISDRAEMVRNNKER